MNLLLHPPGLPQYNYQPVYRDIDIVPIEVWRKRVFPCPLEDINTSVHNPLGVYPAGMPYVEERYHPRFRHPRVRMSIGGLEEAFKFRRIDLNELYEDALRIINGRVKRVRPGRKPEEVLYTKEEFINDVISYYRLLRDKGDRRPSRESVRQMMGISRTTFYKYRNRFGLRSWPPV